MEATSEIRGAQLVLRGAGAAGGEEGHGRLQGRHAHVHAAGPRPGLHPPQVRRGADERVQRQQPQGHVLLRHRQVCQGGAEGGRQDRHGQGGLCGPGRHPGDRGV